MDHTLLTNGQQKVGQWSEWSKVLSGTSVTDIHKLSAGCVCDNFAKLFLFADNAKIYSHIKNAYDSTYVFAT